jgi:hypothetical protein
MLTGVIAMTLRSYVSILTLHIDPVTCVPPFKTVIAIDPSSIDFSPQNDFSSRESILCETLRRAMLAEQTV